MKVFAIVATLLASSAMAAQQAAAPKADAANAPTFGTKPFSASGSNRPFC